MRRASACAGALALALCAAPGLACGVSADPSLAGDGSAADGLFERIAVSLGVIAVAALASHLLGRSARRLPLVLARRRPVASAAPFASARGRRAIAWLSAVPRVAVWLAALRVVGRQLPVLEREAAAGAGFVVATFTKPMLALGDRDYSALDVVLLPATLAALWAGVGALSRLVQSRLARTAPGESSARDAAGIVIRYIVSFGGAIVVLQVWGIDLRSIVIAASVLGVGIGFGLQHLANNFISGLVIGFERPLRSGDFVSVGGLTGIVERVGARSTEIRTIDRVKILVPNSKLLETELVNWTHGDPVSRLHVPIGVAYGSDVATVRAALLEVARSHPDVLADPRPDVQLRRFGDSALEFELLVWTRDPSRQSALVSDLNYRIVTAFRRCRIRIPFPQHDVHVSSPGLERLAAAWLRREGADGLTIDACSAGAVAEGGDADGSDGGGAHGESVGPRAWTDGELDLLVARMRGPGGVAIVDRRHLLRTYRRCFVGSEAVDWLVAHENLGRDEAARVGQLLVDRGVVHHVLDEHPFRDGRFFYRFRADDADDAVERRANGAAATSASH